LAAPGSRRRRSRRGLRIACAALTGAVVLAWLGRAGPGQAFVDGPPLAATGGFGEVSCHQCHFDGDLNPPGGSISIAGLPQAFSPGEPYPLTVTLTRTGLATGGFQLTARFTDGEDKGRQAGDLRAIDARAVVLPNQRRTQAYAQHTRTGSSPTSPGTAVWRVDWIAPAAGHIVAFNLAAVAGDADLSSFGDSVYVREVIVRPAGKPQPPR